MLRRCASNVVVSTYSTRRKWQHVSAGRYQKESTPPHFRFSAFAIGQANIKLFQFGVRSSVSIMGRRAS